MEFWGRTYTKNALFANQLDVLVGDAAFAVSLSIGFEVAKITNVTFGVFRCTVFLAKGVDYILLARSFSRSTPLQA